MSDAVLHNPAQNRFEIEVDGHLAVADYRLAPGRMIITHTGVPPAVEGRGIGSKLAKAALDHARAEGLKVVPQCPFISAYVRRHPDYRDVLV
jgi:predicted GNAT family acetyltransferase